MSAVLDWIKKKLREASTYAGIVVLLASLGISVGEATVRAVSIAIAALIGLYEVLRDEGILK